MLLLLQQGWRLLLLLLLLLVVVDAAVAARRSAAVPRHRQIGLDAVGNDDRRLLLLLSQLLHVRILDETRNFVVGENEWRWRNQRRGHHLFQERMEFRVEGVVHGTAPVPAAAFAAVAPANRSELDQRPANHLLLVILMADLLVDQGQRRNDAAIYMAAMRFELLWWLGCFIVIMAMSSTRTVAGCLLSAGSRSSSSTRLCP